MCMPPAPKHQLSQLDEMSLTGKKQKLNSYPTSFCATSEQVLLDSSLQLGFSFENEMAHKCMGTLASGSDINMSFFDPFLDTPLHIIPLGETSDVSPHDGKIKKDAMQDNSLFSEISTTGDGQDKRAGSCRSNKTSKGDDYQKKRQAERAARNRESSRRAREKHKNRFGELESGYLALQKTVQKNKLQIDHLHLLLGRAYAVQQLCTVCSDNSTLERKSGRQDLKRS